jgi:hypothetical protein
VCVSTGGNSSSGRRENLRNNSLSFPTAAAGKITVGHVGDSQIGSPRFYFLERVVGEKSRLHSLTGFGVNGRGGLWPQGIGAPRICRKPHPYTSSRNWLRLLEGAS